MRIVLTAVLMGLVATAAQAGSRAPADPFSPEADMYLRSREGSGMSAQSIDRWIARHGSVMPRPEVVTRGSTRVVLDRDIATRRAVESGLLDADQAVYSSTGAREVLDSGVLGEREVWSTIRSGPVAVRYVEVPVYAPASDYVATPGYAPASGYAPAPSYAPSYGGLSNDRHYTNVDGVRVHSPAYALGGGMAPGGSALCGDGTTSFSLHSRGTCSHHGGIGGGHSHHHYRTR